jgi:hypothetical protein
MNEWPTFLQSRRKAPNGKEIPDGTIDYIDATGDAVQEAVIEFVVEVVKPKLDEVNEKIAPVLRWYHHRQDGIGDDFSKNFQLKIDTLRQDIGPVLKWYNDRGKFPAVILKWGPMLFTAAGFIVELLRLVGGK